MILLIRSLNYKSLSSNQSIQRVFKLNSTRLIGAMWCITLIFMVMYNLQNYLVNKTRVLIIYRKYYTLSYKVLIFGLKLCMRKYFQNFIHIIFKEKPTNCGINNLTCLTTDFINGIERNPIDLILFNDVSCQNL